LLFLGFGALLPAVETAASELPIDSVVLHRAACFGTCAVYTIEIRPDGEVRYDGEEHVKVKGHHTANISAGEYAFLVTSIERVGFFSLHHRYRFALDGCRSVRTDYPSIDIVVSRAGQKQHVEYYYGCKGLPVLQRILWLADTIDDVAGSARWVGSASEDSDG
jgi:hypothetical protein